MDMDTTMKISTLIDIELHGQVVMQHHLPPPKAAWFECGLCSWATTWGARKIKNITIVAVNVHVNVHGNSANCGDCSCKSDQFPQMFQ